MKKFSSILLVIIASHLTMFNVFAATLTDMFTQNCPRQSKLLPLDELNEPNDIIDSINTGLSSISGVTRANDQIWVSGSNGVIVRYTSNFSLLGTSTLTRPARVASWDLVANIAFDGAYLWAVYEQAALLVKYDATNFAIISTINLPDSVMSDPNSYGLAWDGRYFAHVAYRNNLSRSDAYRIDPLNGISTFLFSIQNWVFGITYRNEQLYGVSGTGMCIYRFAVTTGEIIERLQVPLVGCHAIAPDSLNWLIGAANRYLYRVSGTTLSIHSNTLNAVTDNNLLKSSYPNPFNSSTTISYRIPSPGNVDLKIIDLNGREVNSIFHGFQQPGSYHLTFDGNHLASGTYFVKMQAGAQTQTQKIMLLR